MPKFKNQGLKKKTIRDRSLDLSEEKRLSLDDLYRPSQEIYVTQFNIRYVKIIMNRDSPELFFECST